MCFHCKQFFKTILFFNAILLAETHEISCMSTRKAWALKKYWVTQFWVSQSVFFFFWIFFLLNCFFPCFLLSIKKFLAIFSLFYYAIELWYCYVTSEVKMKINKLEINWLTCNERRRRIFFFLPIIFILYIYWIHVNICFCLICFYANSFI